VSSVNRNPFRHILQRFENRLKERARAPSRSELWHGMRTRGKRLKELACKDRWSGRIWREEGAAAAQPGTLSNLRAATVLVSLSEAWARYSNGIQKETRFS
jgi:hypothetical protein